MSLSRYINNYYKGKKNRGLLPAAAEYKSMWCSLVSSNTVVCAGGGGVLQISNDRDDPRILLGFKFSIPGFFWVGKFGKVVFW